MFQFMLVVGLVLAYYGYAVTKNLSVLYEMSV